MHSTPPKIWYKQFWPWFLIFIPIMSMVLSFTMMNFAFNSEDSMVIDDYYKEGKGINLKLQKVERAKELGISTQVLLSKNAIELTFLDGEPKSAEALTLEFTHTTQKHKDFVVTLLKDAQGSYRAPLETMVSGKWQLTLHPYDTSWKVRKTLTFPQTAAFEFNP